MCKKTPLSGYKIETRPWCKLTSVYASKRYCINRLVQKIEKFV